jgi:hypothetical protein
LVERVSNSFPQAHFTITFMYLGCRSGFTFHSLLAKRLIGLNLENPVSRVIYPAAPTVSKPCIFDTATSRK